jgi:hypothetical protein
VLSILLDVFKKSPIILNPNSQFIIHHSSLLTTGILYQNIPCLAMMVATSQLIAINATKKAICNISHTYQPVILNCSRDSIKIHP